MFNLKVERSGDKLEIELWHGELLVLRHVMPFQSFADRSAAEIALANAESLFHKLVSEWIVKNTPM